jgi:hypothetical protein
MAKIITTKKRSLEHIAFNTSITVMIAYGIVLFAIVHPSL